MRATKAPSKMEIGRRPDRRTEVSELAHIDIVNNLATGKKPPPRAFFGAIYRNITLTYSTLGSELIIAVTAAKATMGFRMYAAELGHRQAEPIELGMDAMAVLDGTKMIKVSREQRYFLTFVLVSTPVLTASTYGVAWPQGDQFLGRDLWHTAMA